MGYFIGRVSNFRGWFFLHGNSVILGQVSAFSNKSTFHTLSFPQEDFQDGQRDGKYSFKSVGFTLLLAQTSLYRKYRFYHVPSRPVLQVEISHRVSFSVIFSNLSVA